MTNKEKNHFLPGSRVEVVFCDRSNSWLEGTVLGHAKTGIVVKLEGGLVCTRTPDRIKHVLTCGFCCVVNND